MKILITKEELYKILLSQMIIKEEYEICAKIRDYIPTIEDPNFIVEIEIEDDPEKSS